MEGNNSTKEGLLEDKPPSNTVCGVRMKKSFSFKNLFALFYINFIVVSTYGYVNVQSIYILRS